MHGNVTVVYDGDGNRVKKIVSSNTYLYLNDDTINPTGYVQVLDEYLNGKLQNSYEYGPMRIAVRRASQVNCYFGCVFPHQYLSNYVDLTAFKNGRFLRINTIDTLADGVTPTLREAAAAALIRKKTPGDHLVLIPKRR